MPDTLQPLSSLAEEIHAWARAKGWYDRPRDVGELIANVHAELSEAWEEYRAGRDLREIRTGEGGKPEGYVVELADALIRLLDMFGCLDVDPGAVVALKMDYNKGRPYRHGGKIA